MFFNSIFLALSSSIDSFGIGITYGLKNTKISKIANFVLFFISFFTSLLSVWFGNILKFIFSDFATKLIGNMILIGMGIFIFVQAIQKDKKSDYKYKEKSYSFFINFLGVTVKIIKNPRFSDFDFSNSIDGKEALFLGIALSLDCFCIGIGGSIVGVNPFLFPLFISVFELVFLSIGNWLGKKITKISNLPDNIWSIFSGILLILIGISRFF